MPDGSSLAIVQDDKQACMSLQILLEIFLPYIYSLLIHFQSSLYCGGSSLVLKGSGNDDIDLCSKLDSGKTLKVGNPAEQIKVVMTTARQNYLKFSLKFTAYGMS